MFKLSASAGETFVGYKLGLTSRNKQQAMGLAAPLYGRVTSGMLSAYGDPVRLDRFIHPRVESEIAFRQGRDDEAESGFKPGERVRIHFVNAMINESAAFHPIAGIWDRVWDNGNPHNVSYGLQTVEIGPAHGMILDLVPPADRATNNAIVDHRMKNAMSGAITVLMTSEEADPAKGKGDQLILRD